MGFLDDYNRAYSQHGLPWAPQFGGTAGEMAGRQAAAADRGAAPPTGGAIGLVILAVLVVAVLGIVAAGVPALLGSLATLFGTRFFSPSGARVGWRDAYVATFLTMLIYWMTGIAIATVLSGVPATAHTLHVVNRDFSRWPELLANPWTLAAGGCWHLAAAFTGAAIVRDKFKASYAGSLGALKAFLTSSLALGLGVIVILVALGGSVDSIPDDAQKLIVLDALMIVVTAVPGAVVGALLVKLVDLTLPRGERHSLGRAYAGALFAITAASGAMLTVEALFPGLAPMLQAVATVFYRSPTLDGLMNGAGGIASALPAFALVCAFGAAVFVVVSAGMLGERYGGFPGALRPAFIGGALFALLAGSIATLWLVNPRAAAYAAGVPDYQLRRAPAMLAPAPALKPAASQASPTSAGTSRPARPPRK